MASTTFDFTANLNTKNCTTAVTAAQVANTINELNSNKNMAITIGTNKCEFTASNKDIVAKMNNKVSLSKNTRNQYLKDSNKEYNQWLGEATL